MTEAGGHATCSARVTFTVTVTMTSVLITILFVVVQVTDRIHHVEVWFRVWRGRRPDPRPFDTRPLDLRGQERPSPEEARVVIRPTVQPVSRQPFESIQGQLALERRQLGVLEVQRKDFRDELLRFLDEEGSAMGLPRTQIREAFRLQVFHHPVKDFRERVVDTPLRDRRNCASRRCLKVFRFRSDTAVVCVVVHGEVAFVPLRRERTLLLVVGSRREARLGRLLLLRRRFGRRRRSRSSPEVRRRLLLLLLLLLL